MSDRILISGLEIACIIGTEPHERLAPQILKLDITLECDLSRAGTSDSLSDTVDYFTLHQSICRLAQTSRFFLLERLADAIAKLTLENPAVSKVTVRVEKPAVLKNARAIVEITREPI